VTIRVHRAWRWLDSLVYGGGFLLAGVIAALIVGALSDRGAGPAETWAPVLVPLGWALITWRLYGVRRRFVDSIAFVTGQGVSVIPGGARWIGAYKGEFEVAISSAVAFWSARFNDWTRITDAVNGLVLVVSDKPLADPKHGIANKKGLMYPGTIAVDGTLGMTDFFAVVRHEIGHVALTAMGVPGDQHATMKQAGWVDA
jgi:hypothetical protein